MNESVISLDGASLTIKGSGRETCIIDDVAMSINRGEAVALTGPSGSGKTSLLMLIGGLEKSTRGQVTVLGRDLSSMNEDALARFRLQNIGIVFQSFHLIPAMTAVANVAVPLELASRDGAHALARAELEAVGLADRADHYPSQMSGGEQQRVAVARASALRPAIILADEPTGNLDSVSGAVVMDMLFSLNKAYASTLVLVTHDGSLAARCDRRIAIRDGRLTAPSRAA